MCIVAVIALFMCRIYYLYLIFVAVTLSFTQSAFIVSEGNGPATAVLTVSEALECCSFSVMVQIEHLTTGKYAISCMNTK